MDLTLFQTDADRSVDGVWCPVDDDTKIKVARLGNKRYQRVLQREMTPYKRLIDKGTVSDDVADKILVTAMAEAILLDWEGMTKHGEPFPYSKQNAVDLLLDPNLKDFRDFVTELSQDIELFRQEEIQEAVEK